MGTFRSSLEAWVIALIGGAVGAGCGSGTSDGRDHDRGKGASAPASASASSAPAPVAPRPSGRQPNIVFILADDQRLDAAGCMPKVKALLGDQGVTFTHNFASTPLCCPGRTTVLTGLYAHNHGVIMNGDIEDDDDPGDDKLPGAIAFKEKGNEERVFARFLREAGYLTGYYGKYLNGYGKLLKQEHAYAPPHWDEWHAFHEPEFYDFQLIEKSGNGKGKATCYLTNREGIPRDAKKEKTCKKDADEVVADGKENYSTDVLADKTIEFIRDAAKAKKPFFVHLAVKAPHGPFWSPARYQPDLGEVAFTKEATDRLAGCKLFDWKGRPESYRESDVSDKPEWVRELKLEDKKANHVRKKQLVSVLANEDALERIVDVLRELGELDDTVIVYTADNGFSWGEHGYLSKNCAYDECAKIPLVVFDPRHPGGGKTLDALTMNIDLAPTFLDLAGAKLPANVKVDGQSMARLFGGDATGWSREYVLTECWGKETKAHPDIHAAVRSREWKYVEHYSDPERTKLKRRKDDQTAEIELYDLKRDPHELDNLARLSSKERELRGVSDAVVEARTRKLAEVLHDLEKQ